ncbi:LOW QUALITY PROTEIN: class II histocompatibility antigen, M alpha chain-like, partial [Aegotheles albertisi]
PSHLLAEVLSCQLSHPTLSLTWTFDTDQLLWFDFPGGHWTPPPMVSPTPGTPEGLDTPAEIRTPVVNVFSVRPPALGEANTLVCAVENIFPPAVEITWQLGGVPITQGVTQTHYTPTQDLTYTRFSYLPVTPTLGDIYACVVTCEGDNASMVTYWVPPVDVPMETLETALTGAAMALGILLALLGISMLVMARG